MTTQYSKAKTTACWTLRKITAMQASNIFEPNFVTIIKLKHQEQHASIKFLFMSCSQFNNEQRSENFIKNLSQPSFLSDIIRIKNRTELD